MPADAGALLGFAATGGSRSTTDEPTLGQLHLAFDHVRQLGKLASLRVVLGQVIAPELTRALRT
jgi:hypothetical protein